MSPTGAVRKLAAATIVGVGVFILSLTLTTGEGGNTGNWDFIEYWASGQLLAQHVNPYDPKSILRLERSQGWRGREPLVMLSPPILLPMILPLGLVSTRFGAIYWSILITGCSMAAIRLIRMQNGQPENRLHLLGYFFAPTLACWFAGQTSAIVLLGLVLFLCFHQTRPLLAGSALSICLLRPHLLVPWGLLLIAFIVRRKAYSIAAGTIVGAAVLIMITLPYLQSWPQYFATMEAFRGERKSPPNLSYLLRFVVDRNAAWIQIAPMLLTCLWAAWYFQRHKNDWNWNTHGSLVLLVSVLSAPYSWFYDEIILLPAILQAVYLRANDERALIGFAALTTAAFAQLLAGVKIVSGYFVWTSVAWVLWCAYALYRCRDAAPRPKLDG